MDSLSWEPSLISMAEWHSGSSKLFLTVFRFLAPTNGACDPGHLSPNVMSSNTAAFWLGYYNAYRGNSKSSLQAPCHPLTLHGELAALDSLFLITFLGQE